MHILQWFATFCVYNKNNRLLCSRITDGIMLII
nr:MAG TPA: hypothetical protein [Caudoviricetes sp.]